MSTALALLAAHALADFPLQSDRMAREKFTDVWVRAGHATTHGWLSAAFLSLSISFGTALAAGAMVAITHFAIDTRRWASPKDGFEAYPIAVDQSLHIASLWAVSVVVL